MSNRVAVVVGINYDNSASSARPLPFAEDDANDMAAVLADAGYKVKLLLGSTATRDGIVSTLRASQHEAGGDGTLVFTFSGHGSQLSDSASALVPADWSKGKYIKLHDIPNLYLSGVGVAVALFDCCHSGMGLNLAFEEPGRVFLTQAQNAFAAYGRNPRGCIVLAACPGDQVAYQSYALKHGFFTYYVLEHWKEKVRQHDEVDVDGLFVSVADGLMKDKRFPPVRGGIQQGRIILDSGKRLHSTSGGISRLSSVQTPLIDLAPPLPAIPPAAAPTPPVKPLAFNRAFNLPAGGDVMVYTNCLAFAFGGAVLTSGHSDRAIRLWETASGKLLKTLNQEGSVTALAVHPVKNQLAAALRPRQIALWDLDAENSQTLVGHTGPIRALAYSPDGQVLASCGDDETLRLWDCSQKRASLITTMGDERDYNNWDEPRVLAFSPDGTYLVMGLGGTAGWLRLFDATRRKLISEVKAHPGGVNSVSFSTNGWYIATGGANSSVSIWEVPTLRREAVLPPGLSGSVESIIFSPNGRLLLAGDNHDGRGHVRVWTLPGDIGTWQELPGTELGKLGWISTLIMSPDGKLLASAHNTEPIQLWDVLA
ncbi:MAG: caspase family protein [Chloroflexota bacterium]|nr:caspase family protein [Chloroflexota bacterium]